MSKLFLKGICGLVLMTSLPSAATTASLALTGPITTTILLAPNNLTTLAGSTSSIRLLWVDNATTELGYYIERSLSPMSGFAKVKELPSNTTSFVDSGLTANTKYYYRVLAYNKDSAGAIIKSGYSNIASATTMATITTTTSTTTTTTTIPPIPTTTTTTTVPAPTNVTGAITTVTVSNPASSEISSVPVTFGQVFAVSHLPAGTSVTGKLADGSTLPLQVNIKAKHADGSARHAIISAVIPKLAAGQNLQIQLVKSSPGSETAAPPTQLLNSGFTTRVFATVNGVVYSASADALLKSLIYKQWLSGPIANEWLVSTPLKDSSGVAHPHLTARFDVRHYAGLNKAKVDVILENNWAYEPAPQNFTYDVQIQVGGSTVYSKSALAHYTHARWKKTFWWGATPNVTIKHNVAYLIGSKAVPNYDLSIPVTETSLASMQTKFTGAVTEPMATGLANAYMPATGGRPDIGILPSWGASYVMSMDPRARNATLGMGDLAGSWSAHYRDKNTDQPISLYDYPYMTIFGNGGDTYNPTTKKYEAFPACGGVCTSKNTLDAAHQPNMSYLPYLMTGDHYYLEELQFYTMWNVFETNPGYRANIKGLLSSEQLRGQGWSLRTLAEAAYITPDADRLKAHFLGILDSNLDWYNTTYTNNTAANALGIITNGSTIVYNNSTGIAPWQDDFFTQSVGHVMDLGFAKAKPLLVWKAKFQIGRMTAPGFCWILGGNYSIMVRDTSSSPFYASLNDVYQKTFTDPLRSLTCASAEMATNLGLKIGEMSGYSSSTEGYPSNYQPALAYSVDSGALGGATAWQVFMKRTVKPNYGDAPQFSIVPRK